MTIRWRLNALLICGGLSEFLKRLSRTFLYTGPQGSLILLIGYPVGIMHPDANIIECTVQKHGREFIANNSFAISYCQ